MGIYKSLLQGQSRDYPKATRKAKASNHKALAKLKLAITKRSQS